VWQKNPGQPNPEKDPGQLNPDQVLKDLLVDFNGTVLEPGDRATSQDANVETEGAGGFVVTVELGKVLDGKVYLGHYLFQTSLNAGYFSQCLETRFANLFSCNLGGAQPSAINATIWHSTRYDGEFNKESRSKK
jgi:hypothetical protein